MSEYVDKSRAKRVLAIYAYILNELQANRPPQIGDEQVAATLANATVIWQAEDELEAALPHAV